MAQPTQEPVENKSVRPSSLENQKEAQPKQAPAKQNEEVEEEEEDQDAEGEEV